MKFIKKSNSVEFIHSGDPFTKENLFGLICQSSSKDMTEIESIED
jgi:hypothetical protein